MNALLLLRALAEALKEDLPEWTERAFTTFPSKVVSLTKTAKMIDAIS